MSDSFYTRLLLQSFVLSLILNAVFITGPFRFATVSASERSEAQSETSDSLVTITLPELTGEPGQQGIYPILISNVTDFNIIAYQFEIVFNEQVTDITKVDRNDTVTPSSGFFIQNPDTADRLNLAYSGSSQTIEEDGVLLYMHAVFRGIGESSLDLENVLLTSIDDGSNVPFKVIEGGIEVDCADEDKPEKVRLKSPTADSHHYNEPDTILFSWYPQPQDSLFFELQISTQENFNSLLAHYKEIEDTEYKVSDLWSLLPLDLRPKTLYWRVRASSSCGVGRFSSNASFNVRANTSAEDEAYHAEEYALDQNYPNPFNSSTTITFHLPETSIIRLDIFDLLGQHVQNLVSSDKPAGSHTVNWDTGNQKIPSGVYLLRMNAVPVSGERYISRQLTRMMTLVK